MLRKKKETQQITPETIAAELEKVNLDASTPEEENNFWEKYEEQQEKIEKQHRGRVRVSQEDTKKGGSPKEDIATVTKIRPGYVRVASDQEKKFCREYMKTFNAKKSALAAGYGDTYAAKRAYMILRRPWVQTYLNELREKIETEEIADANETLLNLTRQMRGELVETIETLNYAARGQGPDKEYVLIGKTVQRLSLHRAGTEGMARYHKLFNEKAVNVNIMPQIVVDIPGALPAAESVPIQPTMSEEEMERRAAELAEQMGVTGEDELSEPEPDTGDKA